MKPVREFKVLYIGPPTINLRRKATIKSIWVFEVLYI
jgi:hypothetical protein